MAHQDPLVILIDVDNTLIDNDGVKADIDRYLAETFGEPSRGRFWELYEDVRRELDVVSFPVVIERLQHEAGSAGAFARLTDYLMRYPFRERLYPGALAALRHLRRFGPLVVLSDGDPWYQGKKIGDAGIGRAVGGNVLIFTHKEEHLDDVRRWYPAAHYAFLDDKPRLVSGIKRLLGAEVTAIWVRQGSYAAPGWGGLDPPADLTLDAIAGARRLAEAQLLGRAPGPVVPPSRRRRAPAI